MKCFLATLTAIFAITLLPAGANATPYWEQFMAPEKIRAPLIRAGLGPTMLWGDLSEVYEHPGTSLTVDWMFHRSRGRGNSGYDFYSRLANSIFFTSDPVKKMLSTTAIECGCRGVLSSFFFPRTLQYYVMAGPRILYYREKVTEDNLEFMEASNLFSLGAAGGAGVEFTPFRSWGFFMELTGGYCPVGDSKTNAEGIRLTLGATYMTEVR